MDLGLKGKKAIICAASKGLGKGCAMALARAGVDLVINARTKATLEATAAGIRSATAVQVTAVACDIPTPDGRAAVLDAAGPVDILVHNAGRPPPRTLRDASAEDWPNALTPQLSTAIEIVRLT